MRKQKQFCKKYVHEGLFPEIYLIGHLQNCCDLEKVRVGSKQTHICLQRKLLSLRIVIYLNQLNGSLAKSCRPEKYNKHTFSEKSEYR